MPLKLESALLSARVLAAQFGATQQSSKLQLRNSDLYLCVPDEKIWDNEYLLVVVDLENFQSIEN